MAGDAPASVHHFAHAVPTSRAEIQLHPPARLQLFERFDMGIAQVVDVDVVANAGAVWCR